jgi:hypothetical protein
MKIDRITIMVEAPAGVVDHEKLLGLVKAELYGSMHGIPHQAQAWSELSPNTRIGGMKRDDEDERCEKCGEPMNEHDRWNRCPVNCAECGIALKAHGAPGTPCPVRMQNYLAQARLAEAQMTVMHNKLLAEGYVETAPGILTSPDGKVVVEW